MKLTDNISKKGLLDLGFEATNNPDIFEYSDFECYIKVECLNTNNWWDISLGRMPYDFGHYGIAIDYNGIKSYCAIYNHFDFLDEFKGKFTTDSQYATLLMHEDGSNEALLKWIHYNADDIKQIVSINENCDGSTVWYIPNQK